jgi:hypothetical protein
MRTAVGRSLSMLNAGAGASRGIRACFEAAWVELAPAWVLTAAAVITDMTAIGVTARAQFTRCVSTLSVISRRGI